MNVLPVAAGDPAPRFVQRCTTRWGHYSFDMAAGRYSILFFFPSTLDPCAARALSVMRARAAQQADGAVGFFGVSADSADETRIPVVTGGESIRFFRDADRRVHDLYGIGVGQCFWVVVDPMLRVCLSMPDAPGVAARVLDHVMRLPPVQDGPVPALMLPAVLEPAFCQVLMDYYHTHESRPSAVLTRGADGKPVNIIDSGFKSRRDCLLRDGDLVRQLQARIIRRVVPEITRVFQCTVTRMDRMVLGRYDAAEGGCFGPHRDNTVPSAAHRLFAISITLNDDYGGGELTFPEFSSRGLRPPAGGAVVFSCALLHAVRPVTQGVRYACLPFAFNEASMAAAREASAPLTG